MINQRLHAQLTRLLKESEREHRAAFAATDGDDPEWPLWYADYLQKPLEQALDTEFGKSQLIYCLMNADFEHTARAPDRDWAEFFASELMEHYAPSETAGEDRLAVAIEAEGGGLPFQGHRAGAGSAWPAVFDGQGERAGGRYRTAGNRDQPAGE